MISSLRTTLRIRFFGIITLALCSLIHQSQCTLQAQQPQLPNAGTQPVTTTQTNASTGAQNGQRPAAPGDVNLDFSKIYIKVGKVGIGHEHGVIAKLKEGRLQLDNGGKGRIVFDMVSMDADAKEARAYVGLDGETDASTRKQVNDNMRGSEVLDVQKHPTSTFEVTAVKPTGKNSERGLPEYIIEGQFTLKGRSRPVTIRSDVETKNGWLHLRGAFSFLQSDFGMKPFRKMLGAVGVSDRLDIYGDLWIAP